MSRQCVWQSESLKWKTLKVINLRCLDNLGSLLEKSLLIFHLESSVHPNLSHFLSEVCFSALRSARVYVKCMPNAKPPLIHTWLGLECTLSHPASTTTNVINLSRDYGIHVAAYSTPCRWIRTLRPSFRKPFQDSGCLRGENRFSPAPIKYFVINVKWVFQWTVIHDPYWGLI